MGVSAAVGALAVAAAAAALKLGTEVVQQFGELEQNIGGSEAVFGEYAASIQKTGEEAYKNLGVSQSEYLATANKMGALFQGSGIEQRRALELTEQAMQRAADTASVMGIDTQAALDSIAGAAKGNFTMMDNLGVAMNATSLQAYALSNGLITSKESAADAEATALKLAQAQNKQATASRAVESAQTAYDKALRRNGPNSQKTQDAALALESAQLKLAAANQKVKEAMDASDVSASNWWNTASQAEKAEVAMQMFFEKTEGYADNFRNEATQTVSGSIGMLQAAIKSFTGGLGNANADTQKLTKNMADAFKAVIDNVVPVLENMMTALPDALPVLMDAMDELVQMAAEKLPQMTRLLLPAVTKLLQSVLDGMVKNVGPITEMAVDLVTSIAKFLLQNLDKLVDAAAGIVIGLVEGVTTMLPELIPLAIEMIAKLAGALAENAGALLAAAPQIIGALITGLANTDWIAVGKSLITGLAGGIANAFSDANKLADAYRQQFGDTQAAYDAFKQGLEQADLNFETAVADAEGKKELAEQLLALYTKLERKEVKTDTDLVLMSSYAKQIAELYPELGQYIDPTTGLFTENTDAIYNNIEAMAQLALVQGYKDYLTELGAELAQATIKYNELGDAEKLATVEWGRLKDQRDSIQGLYDGVFDVGGGMAAFEENLTAIYNTIKDISGVDNPLNGYVDVLANGSVVLREGANSAEAYGKYAGIN